MRDRSIVQPQTVSAQPSAEPRTPQQTNRWPWACTPIVPLSSLPRPTPPGRLGLCAAPLCAPPAGPLALPQALALAAPLPGTRSLHFLIYCPVPREASCPPLDVGGLRSAPHFAAPEVLCMMTSSSFQLHCLPWCLASVRTSFLHPPSLLFTCSSQEQIQHTNHMSESSVCGVVRLPYCLP